MDFLDTLFDTTSFPPRWHCGEWSPVHGWLHILSDIGVWSAYFMIPCILAFYFIRRKTLPFRRILLLFVTFILACGTTHLMEAVIFWWPAYRVAGALKIITALVSWGTVLALFRITPQVMALRSPLELEAEIQERRRAEDALRTSNEQFRSAFEFAPIGMALVGLEGRWLKVNRALSEIVGYGEEELLATDFQSLTHPDDLQQDLEYVEQLRTGALNAFQIEKRYLHKDGHAVYILLSVSLVRDVNQQPLFFIAQMKDITQRKQAEDRMAASLREKEVLLREIHHRVKNNLQIVSSLLDLQSGYTSDPETLKLFEESRGRVRSMALIHERLYRSGDLAHVDVSEYIQQLADDLYRSYKVSAQDVLLDLRIDAPPLGIDVAIPCGLLLNELMSNCLKHAFPDGRGGKICISLLGNVVGEYVLSVADNGVGFPSTVDFRNSSSFGLQLINTIVEQLHGDLDMKTDDGTAFTIRFRSAQAVSRS